MWPNHCSSALFNLFIMCLIIHLPAVFIDNLTMNNALVLAVRMYCLENHAHEHINILEYTDHFRVYTNLRNQGVTNAG